MNFVLFFIGLFISSTVTLVPPIFPVCLRTDPQLANCIIQSVNALRSRLESGDLGSGFRIPQIEPFYIPKINLKIVSQSGAETEFMSSFSNVYVRGLSKFAIKDLRSNIKDLTFDMNLLFPRLDLSAKYNFYPGYSGVLYSQGDASGYYENAKVRVIVKGSKYFRNGVEYIQFQPIVFKFLEQNVRDLNFTNLLQGTFLLRSVFNFGLVFNANNFARNVNPDMEKAISDAFTKIANQIASQASFSELFPN